MPRSGPVLIAYDGTPAAEHAIREGGPLLAGRKALVLVVWGVLRRAEAPVVVVRHASDKSR